MKNKSHKLTNNLIKYFSLILITTVFMLVISPSYAASPQAIAALSNNPALEYAPDSVLVKFKPSASPTQKLNARALVNGEKIRGYGIVQGLEHIRLGKGKEVVIAIDLLQKLPFVDYAEPNYVHRANTNDPLYGLQWGLNNTGQVILNVQGTVDADIDAEETWSITTGNPDFVVAVIDTGVDYNHEDLTNNKWINAGETPANGIDDDGNGYIDDIYGWDFFSNDSDPMDDGHGTHVAGTICAEGNNGVGVVGVAWQCKIMALRFIGPDGGLTADAIAALDYAVNKGVKLSNNSWGGGGFSQSLYDAIQIAGINGHLFVAAAGNGNAAGIGYDTDLTPHYPSSYDLDNIISVAATDNQDKLAGFSNYGLNSVDVGAPGVDIASTMLGGYYWNTGTSMAAPHVTGIAALILGTHPDWTPLQVTDRIYNTVRPIAALDGKTVTGGVVNAYDALAIVIPSLPPIAPSDLSAAAISDSQIDLAWVDNSNDEDGFNIERSPDGLSWIFIASVGKDVSVYSNSSLDAETTYSYRVMAFNIAGDSPYSNVATAITEATPTTQEILANGEIFDAGSISGTYVNTWSDDGVTQSVTETISGGKPSNRYSYLQHTWTFDVPTGGTTFNMNAWSTLSSDGDSFLFSYSLDGTNYTEMLSVNGGDGSSLYNFTFPPDSSGTVYINVTDTDRVAGNQVLDTVTIDHMYILVDLVPGVPPVAPTDLTADSQTSGQVSLGWTDNSSNEDGFEVERSSDSGATWSLLAKVAADSPSYIDTAVSSGTTYDYRVRAYNGSGYSDYSNTVSATTLPSSGITLLTATGYIIRNWQYVDLAWDDASITVDIYRDAEIIDSVSGGFYTDGKIAKGSASYTYQVCESGGTTNCSNELIVNFQG